jgi:hypothetical protein
MFLLLTFPPCGGARFSRSEKQLSAHYLALLAYDTPSAPAIATKQAQIYNQNTKPP